MAAVNITFPGNLAQVETANDLRSIPSTYIPSGALYLVNGLEGLFQYDTGSVLADDGNDALRPYDKSPGQAGRWIRNVDGLAAGPVGPAGGDANSYSTLAGMKAAGLTGLTYNLAAPSGADGGFVNGPFTYQTGNFTGRTDVVKLDAVPLATGALVRQGAASVSTTLPSIYATVKNVEDRLNQMESINAEGLGVRYDTGESQHVAFGNAIAEATRLRRKLVMSGPIAMGGKALLPPYYALTGIAQEQSFFTWVPGYAGEILQLGEGPITFGSMGDIGFKGNGVQGEIGFDGTARPPSDPTAYQHGGPWSLTFDRMRSENVGSAALKLWGGTSGLLPCQFITVRDFTSYRANAEYSRNVTMAGQNGQVFFVGNNEFDGHPSTTETPGVNVVVGMLYYNAGTGKYGDAADALNDDATMRSGWSLVSGDNNGAYVVAFDGTTFQSSIRAILFDNARSCTLRNTYFEAIKQSVTAVNGSDIEVNGLFQNAGALAVSDGQGYIFGQSNSLIDFSKARITGRVDRIAIRLPGSGMAAWRGTENIFMPLGPDVHTIPSDIVQQVGIAAGTLDLGNSTEIYIGDSSGNVEDVNTITSVLPPGCKVAITVAPGSVIRFNPSAKLPLDYPLMLRGGDAIVLLKNDIGAPPEFYSIISRSIKRLVAFSKPVTGFYQKGERIDSIADKVAGTVTVAWECTVSGGGPSSGTSFLALNVTAVAA